jgi:3-oxoacyl-[acyl-carrier protein] reductase
MKLQKIALVTGGSRGIGRAIAEKLARDGFAVVLNYNKSRKLAMSITRKLQRQGCVCVPIKADVTNEKEVERMVRKVLRQFKRIDVLVNNAGINKMQSFKGMEREDYDKLMDTNLRGSIIVTKKTLPFLKKQVGAKIIFITSANAFIGSWRRPAYVISKAGLIGLIRALALELAPNILVNGIAPGYIKTRMTHFSPKELREKLKKIPLRRLGKPEEVAALVSFLASSQNTYITGQIIHINGGLFLS